MFYQIKKILKNSFPALSVILFTFFNLFIAKNFVDFGSLIALHAIFFWLIFSPKFLPPFIILILGFLQDIIYLTPLGSTSLIFLIAIFLTQNYKKFFLNPSFVEVWLSFSFIFILSTIGFLGLISFINFKIIFTTSIIYQIFINLLFFPISYIVCYFFLEKFKLKQKNN
jgi:rod shape-determining protein MreD